MKINKLLINIFITFIILNALFINIALAQCNGRFINPILDVCWDCILPISIGNVEVLKGNVPDTSNPSTIPCFCNNILGIPVPGLPIGLWEAVRIVDVAKEPFCFVSLGGFEIDAQIFSGTGSNSISGINHEDNASWHLHEYTMPLFAVLGLILDGLCLKIENTAADLISIAYMTELDPLWLDDELTFILNPEALIFANTIAQAACSADCVAATLNLPINSLFWCGGCQGSMYPLTGNLGSDYGSVQSSLLAVERFQYKLGRQLMALNTSGPEALCHSLPMPIIKKSQYRTQMTFPVAMNGSGGCKPFGRSNVFYDSGKEIPIKGESFAYLIWRKRNCCAL